MSERRWASGDDPEFMVRHALGAGVATWRKFALFLYARCEHLAGLEPGFRLAPALAVLGRHADFGVSPRRLGEAQRLARRSGRGSSEAARELRFALGVVDGRQDAAALAGWLFRAEPAPPTFWYDEWPPAEVPPPPPRPEVARAAQAAYLRDLFGNPFASCRVAPRAPRSWLAANGGLGAKFLQSLQATDRYADLPFFADALEEGGCDAAQLLAHLRGPGPHVRGCWAVDVLTGQG